MAGGHGHSNNSERPQYTGFNLHDAYGFMQFSCGVGECSKEHERVRHPISEATARKVNYKTNARAREREGEREGERDLLHVNMSEVGQD
jgi:hypothetical protein